MKTTLDIKDELFLGAKHLAKRSGRPLRSIVEEGLRLALEKSANTPDYRLPDYSFGRQGNVDPLENLTWQERRALIYDEPSP